MDAKDISHEFTGLPGMMPASKAAMLDQGNGVYTRQGGYPGMPEKWDIKVVVRCTNKFDACSDFKVDQTGKAGQ
jgi:hypothetical protein